MRTIRSQGSRAMRSGALLLAIAGAFALSATMRTEGQNAPDGPASPGFDVRVLPVQGNVYMIVGAGANIAVQVGEDGVLLVDTGAAGATDAVLAAIREITDQPIRYIINTHAHPDHVGGNAGLVEATGGPRREFGIGGAGGGGNPAGIQIYAHQNTANRMLFPPDGQPDYPDEALPEFTFFTADKQMFINGEAVDLWWHPNAHTDGDVLVYFRRSDVVVAGDLYSPDRYPVFDAEADGGLQGLLDAMNHIVDITVPEFNQIGGTRVIPGHGWLSTESDVVEVRDMGTIIRDRFRHMIEGGMTLEGIKAARPTMDFDPVYDMANGFWTAGRFMDSLYADLTRPGARPLPPSGLVFTSVPGGSR